MYRTKFTDAEWRTVLYTPLWAFYAVAGIDGKVDEKEAGALGKELLEAHLYKNEFTREVLSSLAADFPAIMDSFGKDSRGFMEGLNASAELLDAKMPAGSADDFKRTCLGIAVAAAKASGPLFGEKVSDGEKTALLLVAATLKVKIQG